MILGLLWIVLTYSQAANRASEFPKFDALFNEKQRRCGIPYVVKKHPCFGPGKRQSYPVIVRRELFKPKFCLIAIRRITPHESRPLFRQSVIFSGVVFVGDIPWPEFWRAWVQVKMPQGIGDAFGRKPLIFPGTLFKRCVHGNGIPNFWQYHRMS